jgi:hypothetical protein
MDIKTYKKAREYQSEIEFLKEQITKKKRFLDLANCPVSKSYINDEIELLKLNIRVLEHKFKMI